MASRLDRWVRQHSAGERALARVLGQFFDRQARRIIKGLRDFKPPTPAAVPQVFRVDDEHDSMMEAIAETLIGQMAQGAQNVLEDSRRGRKQFQPSQADFSRLKVPQTIQDAIQAAFIDLADRTYWRDIQRVTGDAVTRIVADGVQEGLSVPKLAKRLRAELAQMGKVRAFAIARTETTGAYNAGHQASYDGLAESGLLIQKEWLSVIDDDTRASHVEADGQKVGVNDDFEVGGERAPYPGHAGLSAANRVNCRCVSAAVFD